MGQDTKIQWCDATFNPWVGCTPVSAGCKHCYAEALARRAPALVFGPGKELPALNAGRQLPVWGPQAPRRVTSAAYWRQPLRWDRAAEKAGERRRVFCASLADVFEDYHGTVVHPTRPNPTLAEIRMDLWTLIRKTPHLDWLLLTKRPERIQVAVPAMWWNCWPQNVWIGCTVENQEQAERRLPHLLRVPAPVRFVSYEPALEAVNFAPWLDRCWPCDKSGINRDEQGRHARCERNPGLNWLIVGGESGPGARPFELAWARQTVAQCKAASVPIFVKQLGARPYELGEAAPPWRPIDRKGGDWSEWAADLRVRQVPAR